MKSLLAVSVIVLAYTCALYGQTGRWHRDPGKCSRLIVYPLSSLPPLSSDMPLDVLISWIVVDSICRTVSPEEVENYVKSTSDDTLRLAMKYLYSLHDYSALLLDKYNATLDTTYESWPRYIRHIVTEEYRKRFGLSRIADDILVHSRILLVTVDQKWEYPDSLDESPVQGFCAAVSIDSAIVGRVHYDECLEGGFGCELVSWIYSDTTNSVSLYYSRCFPPNVLENGKRYLLYMLDVPNEYSAGIDRYYTTLSPLVMKENTRNFGLISSVFEIQNGVIHDGMNYFGLGEYPTIVDVVNTIRGEIDILLNR